MRGWVYIITTESMPDLVKIGFSTKDPELRAIDLKNPGNPQPYKVEYDILVNDPRNIEQRTHQLLAAKCANKEWFRCTVNEAIEVLKEVVQQTEIVPKEKKHVKTSPSEYLDIFEHEAIAAIQKEISADYLERSRLAKQGNVSAQYELGLMYQMGEGIGRDYQKAINWYTEAAKQGHIIAQLNLGCMFYSLSPLDRNYEEAMKWFSHAAKRGNADALYYMANMYQHGHGVMRDVKMAEGFYVQAIENGDNYMIKKVVRACLNKHGALIK